MDGYSWNQQLQEIKNQVAAVFGRDMILTDRAKQALLASGMANDEHLDDASVLCELLSVSPSCALALTEIGWNYDWIGDWRPARSRATPPMKNLAVRLFSGFDESRPSLTPAAKAAQERGVLSDSDILLSIAQTTIHSDSDGYIATLAAHFIEDGWWGNPDLEKKVGGVTTQHGLNLLQESLARIDWLDPDQQDQQFGIFLDESGLLRVRPFSAFGAVEAGAEFVVTDRPLVIGRGGFIQDAPGDSHAVSAEAIAILEDMINSNTASEADYQSFFEAHPDLLSGIDYGRIHPHLVLHRDEGSNLIPDFFLERLSSDYCDILELKLPYDSLVRRLRRGSRTFFRSTVEEAKSQLLEYRDWFNDKQNREAFHQQHQLNAFRPRMILVVGRRMHFRDEIERLTLEDRLPKDLHVWTYDDLVERARRYRQLVHQNKQVEP